MKRPELVAPGGSFQSAWHAFEAGADGVYVGLREFSARAMAQNVSLDQLRRLRQLAADRGRRLYVALNTVIRDDELPRLQETLHCLEALRVHGVIVQDLGVLDLVRRDYPGLPIHASTQMGVHNDSGLDLVRQLGAGRAILARELPLERIRGLRERHPGMELEVFIHGALCYSFSGACLASWALTGRSGNRGQCAQVCRSRFVSADAREGDREPAHPFSTRDLFLGMDVLELAACGVDALKIEGRMKAPEYAAATTRLYRELLDAGEPLPARRYEELVRNARLAFSRRTTIGWFRSPRGTRLLETGAPGHRGVKLGTVRAIRGRWIELQLEGDLSRRDGLGYLVSEQTEPAAFSVERILRDGHEVGLARKGDIVRVEVPAGVVSRLPEAGQEVRQLSSRLRDLAQPKEGSVPRYKVPIDLSVELDASGQLTIDAPGFPSFSRRVTVIASDARRPFWPIFASLLGESGESWFRPGRLVFSNRSGRPEDGIFIRPGELKRAKNEWYRYLDASFWTQAASHPQPRVPAVGAVRGPWEPDQLAGLGRRQQLAPPGSSPVPFVGGDPADLRVEHLAWYAGLRWLPLAPVLIDEAPWIEAVKTLVGGNPRQQFAVGLSNVSHLALASALAGLDNAWFFADFFLYAANPLTLSLLAQRVPRLLFAYEWLEQVPPGQSPRQPLLRGGPVLTVRLSSDFQPPLFYSLACFLRHSVHRGACAEDCSRRFSGELRQGRNRFRIVVRDCVTYLFLISRSG